MIRLAFFICLLLCALAAPAQSQSAGRGDVANAQLSGVVRDRAGAAIAGAEVTERVGGVVRQRATTNEEGRFRFAEETPAGATLIVRADGFALFEQQVSAAEVGRGDLEIVLAPAGVSEGIVVSAARTETRLNETPASVVVLDREQLETTAAAPLDDALKQVPGFQLFRRTSSRYSNPTAQGVSLRGTGASGASRALVLADNVSVLDPFGGWVYWGRIPRLSVNRIEVLRGAASDLYGSSALGGVISISRRRTDASFALSLDASLGSLQTPEASLWMSTRRGNWGVALAAEAFSTDGYVLVAEAERGAVDTPAASRRRSGEITLERFFGNAAANRLSFRAATYWESRLNGTPLQTNRTGVRDFQVGADGDTNFLASYSLRFYGGTQTYDQTFSSIVPDRSAETLTRRQRVPAQFVGASGQASRTIAQRHTFIGGFDAREVHGASDEIIYVGGRASSIVGAGGRERTYGFFASDISRLGDRLILSGSLRLDRWRNYRALSATRPLAARNLDVTEFPERIERAFSPRLSALLRLTDNVSVSASLARAFRQPTLNELYRAFRVGNVLTLANENLRAERATNGEAGAIFSFFDRRLTARTTMFLTDVARPVANVTLSATPTLITRRRENLGRTRTIGFEAEAEARVANDLTISGGYLTTSARVRDFPAAPEIEGLFLPQVARHQGTFQVRYANSRLLTIGLQGRALGKQFDDDQNRFPLRSFLTLDLFAARQVKSNFEVFVAAENLTNSRYDVGRTPVLTIAPPATIRFGVRVKMGDQDGRR